MRNTILIVEDNEHVGQAMSRRLLSFGFEVLTATSPLEANSLAKTCRPDVVLLDERLSADGALSDADWASGVPFVLMSGDDPSDAASHGQGLPAMPFSADDLLDSVSDALWRDLPAANEPF